VIDPQAWKTQLSGAYDEPCVVVVLKVSALMLIHIFVHLIDGKCFKTLTFSMKENCDIFVYELE